MTEEGGIVVIQVPVSTNMNEEKITVFQKCIEYVDFKWRIQSFNQTTSFTKIQQTQQTYGFSR